MGKGANEHWDVIRKLCNKLMRECLSDAVEMVREVEEIRFSESAYLAGKLFDARWQGASCMTMMQVYFGSDHEG